MSEQCPGCGHRMHKHYRALDGTARCLVTASGTSTSGVIGLPWSRECDCCDGVSEHANAIRKREQEEREQEEAWTAAITAAILLDMSPPSSDTESV